MLKEVSRRLQHKPRGAGRRQAAVRLAPQAARASGDHAGDAVGGALLRRRRSARHEVDEVRKGRVEEASVILPLADITEVKPLETGGNVSNWSADVGGGRRRGARVEAPPTRS